MGSDGVITHLEPDTLEYKVKWALGSIKTNKASGDDGIPAELFQILKDVVVKVLHSIYQQLWKPACQSHKLSPANLAYMQRTLCETLGWRQRKLESRLQGEVPTA